MKTTIYLGTITATLAVAIHPKNYKFPEPPPPVVITRTAVLVKPNVPPPTAAPRKRQNISRELVEAIKKFEGFRSEPYVCPGGKKTIGFGTTDPKIVARGKISRAEAERILKEELAEARRYVEKIVEVPLSEPEREALTSFTHNLGPGALKTLVAQPGRLNDGNRESIFEVLPLYRNAKDEDGNLRRLKGLVKRRAFEIELFGSREFMVAAKAAE